MPLTSRADVATDAADRFAKQLVSHLAHKIETRDEPEGQRLVFSDGSCLLTAQSDRLMLTATADTEEGLRHVQRVVGSHLQRFGQRTELTVTWVGG